MPTEEDCIRGFAEVIATSDAACAAMTPREQAEAAWTPTSPYSVDELEDLIRSDRGIAPIHHDPAAMADLARRDQERVSLRGGARAKPVDHDGM